MANLIRSAKLGSDWGRNDLLSHRITVTAIPPQEFFHQGAEPSLAGLDPALITSPLDATNVSDDIYRFLSYLDLATNASQEAEIDDFAREFLHIVGFGERGRVLCTRHKIDIPLSILGDINNLKVAQTDVCLLDRLSTILLVIQENKTIFDPSDPEPQVIAEAIAAYQHNNQKRQRMGLSTLNTMTVPCITMIGTRPIFYLVPVTQELSDAVITGRWPEIETEVLKCVTVVGHNGQLSELEGMETPEYRRVAFQCMSAFKALAKSQWEKFLFD
jgi:hypothetical protein